MAEQVIDASVAIKSISRWLAIWLMSCIVLVWMWLKLTDGLTANSAHSIKSNLAHSVPLRILFPADRSIIEGGKFQLICVQQLQGHQKVAPPLLVDGVRKH